MKMTQDNLEFLLQAVSMVWLEEWLKHHTYAAELLTDATKAGLNADFYNCFHEILLDWLDFMGVSIDQSNLVTAMQMEWGQSATRSDSVSGSEVDCTLNPRNHNEGNEVATVHIAGMDVDYWLDDSHVHHPCYMGASPVTSEELMRLLGE